MTTGVSAAPVQAAAGLRRILSNALALLFAYLLPRVFTFTSVVVAARVLGTEDFGGYGTAAAFAVMLSIVATLGMIPLLVREIARDASRAPGLLRAAHLVKTVSNAVMLVALFVLASVLGLDQRVADAALLLGIGYALGAYAENLSAYFQAVERMYVWTQASALFGFVSGAVGVVAVLRTNDLVWFCVGPAAGWSVALAWLLARAPRDVRVGSPATRAQIVALLRALVPFAAAFVLLTVYYKVDVLLLARWTGAASVGVYAAAYKFVDIFQALVIVAAAAVYPRLSRQAADRAGGGWAGGRSTELLLLAAVPAALGLHLLAGPIIGLLFGPEYGASVPVLRTLALALPFLTITIHGGYVLAASERMLPVAGLYLLGVALNVGLNALLIPSRGAAGAALAMLGSETVLAALACVGLATLADAAPRARVVVVGSVGLAAGLVAGRLDDPTHGVAATLLSTVLVVWLYRATGVVSARDIALVRAALGRRGAEA